MDEAFFSAACFTNKDFENRDPGPGEYELCEFRGVDLSGKNMAGMRFIDCVFTGCDLSRATFSKKTEWRDTRFSGSKLMGIHFEDCNDFLFSASFENCNLQYSSFYGMKLKNILFRKCGLRETDFTLADLTGAVIGDCDLALARFENTILEKTDLRHSYNFSIDPERNRIKKARFSLAYIQGLLEKYEIQVE